MNNISIAAASTVAEADLAAALPHQGMPDYRDRVPPALWRGTLHQPDLADIR